MKKFKSIIFAVLLLFSCLGLTAFAENSSITISEDFQELYMDGNTYTRFNVSTLEISYDVTIEDPVELSAEQQETIDDVYLQANQQRSIIYAEIYFKDGATLTVEFLQDDYLETYNEIVNGQSDEYLIDFIYPEGNTVTAKRVSLFGNPATLYKRDLEWCDEYQVTAQNEDSGFIAYKGSLIIIDEVYYYVDYNEIGVESWHNFYPSEYDELPAYEITDEDLLENLKEAEEKYYADDLGFFYDDDFTESISAVFLIIVFAVIPLVIAITFLILAIRSKAVYRKLFSTICILSAAELGIFIILATTILMLR